MYDKLHRRCIIISSKLARFQIENYFYNIVLSNLMLYNYVKYLLSCDDHDGLGPKTIFVFVLKKIIKVLLLMPSAKKVEKKILAIKKIKKLGHTKVCYVVQKRSKV